MSENENECYASALVWFVKSSKQIWQLYNSLIAFRPFTLQTVRNVDMLVVCAVFIFRKAVEKGLKEFQQCKSSRRSLFFNTTLDLYQLQFVSH